MIYISFFSNLYYNLKQENIRTGFILYIVITFISSLINPIDLVYFLNDLDYMLGAIIGVIFALKFRKPDQSPLKYGLIIGITGGFLSSIPIAVSYVLIYRLDILWFFPYIGMLCLTGLVLGLIIGGFIGWFYMNKEEREKQEEKYNEDFFKDLTKE